VALLKPETFMNLSGQSVGEAMRFFKLEPGDVTVFHDEIDLPPARLKVKTGGGHAGHNGLRSIHAHVGEAYQRVRMGVGHPGRKEAVAGYVLHDFAKADEDWLDDMLRGISDGAAALAAGDAARFQNAVALRLNPPRSSGGTVGAQAAGGPAPERSGPDATARTALAPPAPRRPLPVSGVRDAFRAQSRACAGSARPSWGGSWRCAPSGWHRAPPSPTGCWTGRATSARRRLGPPCGSRRAAWARLDGSDRGSPPSTRLRRPRRRALGSGRGGAGPPRGPAPPLARQPAPDERGPAQRGPPRRRVLDRGALPLALRAEELGASAGLNLSFDRFALDAGGVRIGAADSPVRLAPEWRGAAPTPHPVRVTDRAGVDLNPLDPQAPGDRLRLSPTSGPTSRSGCG
jgi:peptidyl-tRNA hydrolase, PTH1 family